MNNYNELNQSIIDYNNIVNNEVNNEENNYANYNSLDDIPQIKEYYDIEDPNLEQMAKAYTIRDIYYNLNLNEIKNNAIEKLGYKNFDEYINNKVIHYVREKTKDYLNNLDNNSLLDIKEIRNRITIDNLYIQNNNRSRCEILENANSIKEFYNLCTIDELLYLGW